MVSTVVHWMAALLIAAGLVAADPVWSPLAAVCTFGAAWVMSAGNGRYPRWALIAAATLPQFVLAVVWPGPTLRVGVTGSGGIHWHSRPAVSALSLYRDGGAFAAEYLGVVRSMVCGKYHSPGGRYFIDGFIVGGLAINWRAAAGSSLGLGG